MTTELLLIVIAVIEFATGIALLITPSLTAELLLGAGLSSSESLLLGRVAGAALVSIGITCWLERHPGRRAPRTGLVVGLLAYNVSVPILLVHAAVADKMRGIALWPATVVHAVLSLWCIVVIFRTSPR